MSQRTLNPVYLAARTLVCALTDLATPIEGIFSTVEELILDETPGSATTGEETINQALATVSQLISQTLQEAEESREILSSFSHILQRLPAIGGQRATDDLSLNGANKALALKRARSAMLDNIETALRESAIGEEHWALLHGTVGTDLCNIAHAVEFTGSCLASTITGLEDIAKWLDTLMSTGLIYEGSHLGDQPVYL